MELLESSVKLDFQTLRQEIVAEIRKRMIDVFRRIDEKVEHVLSTEHREYIYICMACFRHYLPASVLYEEVPALKLE